MKTIKQLQKEIKELENIYSYWGNSRYNKREELIAKLQTLQEVCKEIDKQIKNYQKLNKKFPKNQTFVDMWTALFALQLRLEGEE